MTADALCRLSWKQALAWRMARHHLLDRVAEPNVLQVVGDICGLHAQLTSSAELSLWVRLDGLRRDALEQLLWQERTLAKLWAMRGTLHLLPSSQLGVWISALSTYTDRGMTGHPEIDTLIEAVSRALDGQILTREQLALEVERLTGEDTYGEYVRFSWGSYLKPGSFRGLLCFAQNDGSQVRFTTPASWLPGGVDLIDPADALREVTRRYLAAYAPATAADLALWWGGYGPARGRWMLAALGDEVVEVDVEGERRWVLARDIEEMSRVAMAPVARLLPAFDPWVVGASRDAAALLDPLRKRRVFRPQGWISPVVLVNGQMVGVWKQTRKRRRVLVEIDTFERLPSWARRQIEHEAERLAAFSDSELSLAWVD